MSPAKRKKATTARRGAARGAGGGRASLAGSKRKTPAKGKGHRGAGAGKAGACDMPREQLERLLDREAARADVLAHVPACHPCTTALTVAASQRDFMQHLAVEPAGTAVQVLLRSGERAGAQRLADLVYELAKACLASFEDLQRRVRMVQVPRSAHVVHQDIDGISTRLSGRLAAGAKSSNAADALQKSDAMLAWRSSLAILNSIEGRSARHELMRAVLLIHSDQPSGAVQLLTTLMQTELSEEHRKLAHWNLLWALIRQQKFEEVLSAGKTALAEYPGDWTSTYNLAVASAWLRRSALFQQYARSLAQVAPISTSERNHRRQLLAFEAPRFAECLGIETSMVRKWFALTAGDLVGNEVD